jgi:hypothetical protein
LNSGRTMMRISSNLERLKFPAFRCSFTGKVRQITGNQACLPWGRESGNR